MNQIAEFEFVSEAEYTRSFEKLFPEKDKTVLRDSFCAGKLPKRATSGSAGYDFYSPVAFSLKPGESITIPSGVRCRISEGWALFLFPRSGLGFKYRLMLNNTVGVIDSDYYGSDNEGHILIRLTNAGVDGKTLVIHQGDAFVQGIFLPFGITENDAAQGKRNGGFGSTG